MYDKHTEFYFVYFIQDYVIFVETYSEMFYLITGQDHDKLEDHWNITGSFSGDLDFT